MRTLMILGVGAAMLTGGAAEAQRPGASYPMPGRGPVVHPRPGPAPVMHGGGRWGSNVNGRWWGGANAPGGWAAYRRPVRGYVLPSYWVAPRFYVNDWQGYGFRAPAAGYNWVRYYDDAVLVDGRGSVWDYRYDVDWDRQERREDGLGGAAIGAVAGGVAGNVIAGRGNRLGGTLIGAGVGAAAGYAIDKAEDRGRDREYRYDRDGQPPIAPDYPPAYDHGHAGPVWTSPDGRTTVVTNTGGWGSTTTVTVQSAPVVTTTVTEEVIEDRVTYRRPVRSKVRYRTKTRPMCNC